MPIKPGRIIGGPGSQPGFFTKPRAIDTDGTNLFVVDRSGRVQIVDPVSGDCLAFWKMPDTQLGYPTGITIGPSPTGDGKKAVWIPDTHYNRVLVYAMPPLGKPGARVDESHPALLLSFGTYGTGPGQFTYPSDVALATDASGTKISRIYVSEFGGDDRVSIFSLDKPDSPTFISSFGGPANDDNPNGFLRPQSIAIEPDTGDLIISDSIDHRIGRFAPDGSFKKWIGGSAIRGTSSATPGAFSHPRGLLLLKDHSALVVEFGNNRIQRIDTASGQSLGLWGTPGSGPGELAEPWAICAIGPMAYIVDARNHRIIEMNLPATR